MKYEKDFTSAFFVGCDMSQAFETIYPIGLGTGRFFFQGRGSFDEDFENAVNLVLCALDNGINYIDVAKGYSGGHAYAVLKEAFRRTDKAFNVTVKVNAYDEKLQAENYYQESLSILEQMGLDQASHFLLWSLMDRGQFHRAIASGGLYDAAIRLKREGRIRYIGASVHMRRDEITEVIDSGFFEFVLISYNLLNFLDMQPVLDMAYKKSVDILVMNPLYGGMIPQNEKMFTDAKLEGDETVVQAAVRAVLAHPAVKCVLAGAANIEELNGYLSAAKGFASDNMDARGNRITILKRRLRDSKTFCSYCRYCAGCPKGIPVPELMNARNAFVMQQSADDLSVRQTYFKVLHEKYDIQFEDGINPCIQCGKCEQRCTQHLPIIQSVQDIYGMVRKSCYDYSSRRERFDALLNRPHYHKVGFWPASAGTLRILNIYKELFGEIPFEVFLFDSNEDTWGREKLGYTVHGKSEAQKLGVECILITSYLYGNKIYKQIKDMDAQGIEIKRLYQKDDVDWWW